MISRRRYYFTETYYHHLSDRRRDEQEMQSYGEVGHDDRGAYWLVAKPKQQVANALKALGYELTAPSSVRPCWYDNNEKDGHTFDKDAIACRCGRVLLYQG